MYGTHLLRLLKLYQSGEKTYYLIQFVLNDWDHRLPYEESVSYSINRLHRLGTPWIDLSFRRQTDNEDELLVRIQVPMNRVDFSFWSPASHLTFMSTCRLGVPFTISLFFTNLRKLLSLRARSCIIARRSSKFWFTVANSSQIWSQL